MRPCIDELMELSGLSGTSEKYRSAIARLANWEYFGDCSAAEAAVARALTSAKSSSRFLWKLAREEQCGAALLGHVAQGCAPDELRPELRKHSRDEARHARMYFALAHLWARSAGLPELTRPVVEAEEEFGPAFRDQFDDFIMSIHLAEIRNYVLVTFLGEGAAGLSSSMASRLCSLSARLLKDETWHVRYTGGIVDEMLHDDPHTELKFAALIDSYAKAQHQEVENIRAFAD